MVKSSASERASQYSVGLGGGERTGVLASRFSVEEEGPTAKVAAENEERGLRFVVHAFVHFEDLTKSGEDLVVVEMQVGEDDKGGFVLRRTFGCDQVSLQE